jgi:hypothetical protein
MKRSYWVCCSGQTDTCNTTSIWFRWFQSTEIHLKHRKYCTNFKPYSMLTLCIIVCGTTWRKWAKHTQPTRNMQRKHAANKVYRSNCLLLHLRVVRTNVSIRTTLQLHIAAFKGTPLSVHQLFNLDGVVLKQKWHKNSNSVVAQVYTLSIPSSYLLVSKFLREHALKNVLVSAHPTNPNFNPQPYIFFS